MGARLQRLADSLDKSTLRAWLELRRREVLADIARERQLIALAIYDRRPTAPAVDRLRQLELELGELEAVARHENAAA